MKHANYTTCAPLLASRVHTRLTHFCDFPSFFSGCNIFIPVFDPTYDTYEGLMERTPWTFDALLARKADLAETVERDLDAILAGTEGDLEKQRAYAARLGATLATAPQGHVFFNGKHYDLDDVSGRVVRSVVMLAENTDVVRRRTSCGTCRTTRRSSCSTSSTRCTRAS